MPTLLVAGTAACLGSSLLFGYSMAVLNNLEKRVKVFFTVQKCDVQTNNGSSTCSSTNVELQYALLTSVYIVSGTIGCFCSGVISDKYGRRNSILGNNIIGLVGGGTSLLVMWTESKINMFVGRLILGLNAGITTGIVPLFLSEISPTIIRGSVIACHQLCVTLGITIAYLMTMEFSLNTSEYWIGALAIPMIPSAISFCILIFVPESPRYLIQHREDVKAIKSCLRYNYMQSMSDQIKEMRQEMETNECSKFRFWDILSKKEYKIPILIAIFLNAMQQFSGINAIIGYSKTILKDTKLTDDIIQYCVLGIGILNSIISILSVPLIEQKGRRPLLILSASACIFVLISLFLTIGIIPNYVGFNNPIMAYISIGFLNIFIVAFALGLGPIPCIMVTEMFIQSSRSAACSLSLAIQWACSFLILICYPVINNWLPPGYVFIIFASMTGAFLTFIIVYMPETKNKSFRDIASKLYEKPQKEATATSSC